MKKFLILIIILLAIVFISNNQSDPVTPELSTFYSEEQAVSIVGYEGDAMEPFISRDGNFLFFNSLNDGQDTSLYYATRVNDVTFQFVGEVLGVNGEVPHLDGVASLDNKNNFYWVSLRDYPTVMENLQTGTWENGEVSNPRPVLGDFYVRKNGWLIMDAEISPDGQQLYYVNADFSNGDSIPQTTILGVAHKQGGEFLADKGNEKLFATINKLNLVYAPSISNDGLTLIFSRLIRGKGTELYIAQRDDITLPFQEPEQINVTGDLPEGGSLSLDTKSLYYHKKDGGTYQIFKTTR